MAHTITTQTIVDGSLNKIIKINIKGDALTATELVKAVIYDSSAYVGDTTDNKLMEIEYALNDFYGELFWDATTDVALISIAENHPTHQSFEKEGGIVNNAGTGRTGDILISTTGLASTTNDAHIILYIKQRGIDFPR